MVSEWYNASSIRQALPRRSDWLTRAAEPEDLLLGHFAVVNGTTLVDAGKQVQTLVAATGAGLSRKATGASVTYRCLARRDIKPREALRWGASQEDAALCTGAGVDLSSTSKGDHQSGAATSAKRHGACRRQCCEPHEAAEHLTKFELLSRANLTALHSGHHTFG